MARKYKSRIMKHIYETAKDLYAVGAITAERLREYEVGCTVTETEQTSDTVHCVSSPVPAYAVSGAGHSQAG
jgi:DNA-binding transcriptional regulator YiaG